MYTQRSVEMKDSFIYISANPPPIPDGPFNPTNYSGTQINVWGGAPPPYVQGGTPGVVHLGQPGICNPYTTQYGYLTENMLQVRKMCDLKKYYK